jgi:nucleotide-binding universal stress UspA family protein
MSIRTILVHANPESTCDGRVRLAVQVAGLFGASVTGLGAEVSVGMLPAGDATFDGAIIGAFRVRIAAGLPDSEKHFRELTGGRQGFAWVSGEGYPDRMLALHARGADLIVAGRPGSGEGGTYSARPADLIMEAGVPVLLMADDDVEFHGERIVVGWKDARATRRALSDSLPFLRRAKAVFIVAVCDEVDTARDEAPLREVAHRLARHGIEAEVEVVPKGNATVAETLDTVASRHSADMIVVGAYGHSRLEEWILGGVTEDLIAFSSRFVLLSH